MKKLNKIVLVGPVYPFKGGISHYTGLLCRELRKTYDVAMMSFKMQYPRLLFRTEQKDYENKAFAVENTDFAINTANPINWIGCIRKIKKLDPDLMILQWWHPYFAPCYIGILKMLPKEIGVLFICHNVFPHERFPLDKWLAKHTLNQGKYYIVQSAMDERDLYSIIQHPLVARAVHPTYKTFRLRGMGKQEARDSLGIPQEQKILLFFGFVREYKGLKHLIKALPKVAEEYPECRLWIAGDFGRAEEEYRELIAECGMEQYIVVRDGYIPDCEIEPYFAACDAVVLPYESATQSGIVQMAFGFGKPVIVTESGGLPDVVEDGRTGYVVPPKDAAALAGAIILYYKENKEAEFSTHVEETAERFSWSRLTDEIEGLWDGSNGNE